MNKDKNPSEPESFKALQILDELSRNDSLTQRDLSRELGIALGLVNSYIKNLVRKGYITVKAIPPRRYAYFLTPKGFAEKTRLTFHLLQDYTRIYREAREKLQTMFKDVREKGVKDIVFAGADEVAEIAYISLQETELVLRAVVDGKMDGKKFFEMTVKPFSAVRELDYDMIFVVSYMHRKRIYEELRSNGVPEEEMRMIFPL